MEIKMSEGIKDVCFNKDEFKALGLEKVCSYANGNIYKGHECGIRYLLDVEHDPVIGNYYKGVRIEVEELKKRDLNITLDKNTLQKGYNITINKEEGTVEYESRRLNRPGGGGWEA